MSSSPTDARDNRLPFVSVVLPLYNEAQVIRDCLGSVLGQDYPQERFEVLVVDGGSTDESLDIVQSMQSQHGNLRLLHDGSIPTSLNLGIREARGELFVRMDCHSLMDPDYIGACVEAMQRTGADNVGGRMRPRGRTFQGKSIALATSSRFGIGGGKFHYSEDEEYVDTVYLGCYSVERLRSLGGYDESLVSEDDELNFRLVTDGGRVLLAPTIRSVYFCRSSLAALWSQYYRYGKGKVKLLQKHGTVSSIRHFVPSLLVAALVAGVGLGFSPLGWWPLIGSLGSYAAANLVVTLTLLFRTGWSVPAALLPLTFLTLHLAYGMGFWAGLLEMFRPRATSTPTGSQG